MSTHDQLLQALLISQSQRNDQRQETRPWMPHDQSINDNPVSFAAFALQAQPLSNLINLNLLLDQQSRRTSLGLPSDPLPSQLTAVSTVREQLPNIEQGQRNSQSARRPRRLTEREHFLIFVKILFKCIDQTGDPRLRPRAKATVTECTQRNRMGDANYHPLQEALETRLRKTVGELHWARAKLCFDQYCRKNGIENLTAV